MNREEIVRWNKTYSVNIPLIDSQHMELVRLTNKLYQSCLRVRNANNDTFTEVLKGAVGYVGYHFSTEEQIMERVNYPGYGTHKKEHADFVREVLKTISDFSKDSRNYNPMNFVKYLKDWILTHIAVSDTMLGQHLVNLKRLGTLDTMTMKVQKIDDRFMYK